MGVPGNADLLLLKTAVAGGYQVSRSLRFSSGDSSYLSRTPASAGNRKTFTWSGWYKAVTVGTAFLFGGGTSSSNDFLIAIQNDVFRVYSYPGSYAFHLQSTAVFRDPSAWYHLVVAIDTTQATSSDRVKLYVNGTQLTVFNTANYPTQNTDLLFNSAVAHYFGYSPAYNYSSFYLAETHFIDGQQLTPSSFGETDSTTGQWIPRLYSGSYGTNGFKLNFSDNSAATATTLGKDTANSNNWTPNNFSVTAGAGNDSLVDTPTSVSATDTGIGGEIRGNYATLNPLNPTTATLSNGNLDCVTNNAHTHARSTIGMSSGKWYWEIVGTTNGNNGLYGIVTQDASFSNYVGQNASGWGYYADGQKYTNNTNTNYGASFTNNDVIGVAFDADNGTLTFYKNGTSQGQAFSGLTSGPYFAAVSDGGSTTSLTLSVNFGQRSWAYQAPAGFKALVDTNLTAPVIAKSDQAFQTVIWTGDGSSSRAITGLSFSPDLLWVKRRNSALDHFVWDSVRGVTKELYTNQTYSEGTASNKLSSFDTNGFTVQNNSAVNALNDTYVGWVWDAGATTSSNGSGSINSQVRANTSAGFSVVTWTGTGSGTYTVGHGLGVAPSFYVVKFRSVASNWDCYHASLGNAYVISLNTTGASLNRPNRWNSTSPTSTVFSIGTDINDAQDLVAYCFAPVAGYSSMGSYVGNGSSDGPAVWLGFRPKWLLIKRTDSANDWYLQDSARDPYNPCPASLFPNLSAAEDSSYRSAYPNDMLSNGFKLRTSNAGWNASGGTYIYIAFAESPFQYARAR